MSDPTDGSARHAGDPSAHPDAMVEEALETTADIDPEAAAEILRTARELSASAALAPLGVREMMAAAATRRQRRS